MFLTGIFMSEKLTKGGRNKPQGMGKTKKNKANKQGHKITNKTSFRAGTHFYTLSEGII